ncbi:galactokinase [Proteiniclasticum sp. SCR006]|uniref:Galactokinase n=1 Tax=Proteiniclasticum aestuarii TaxID=2817862 RepID=A0A939H8N7_9CLOT|nr:galactokinase [Proteiniclasticum aestuarii]MBO1266372.1 galactokinase [Proteiniclasticum aestuarii]
MEVKTGFRRTYQENPEGIYFAPGRVNLIGEHTDYNGGNVFPCALTIGTYAAVKKREDRLIRLFSENFPQNGVIQFSLDELVYDRSHDWANYPKGVIKVFMESGYIIPCGMDFYYSGNIPNGAGLSSSASIEVVTALILKELFQFSVEMIELVKLCQKAENAFIGVNSGIMDQFAVAMGEKDKAILLDTNSLQYRYADIRLKDASIIVANTNKKRGLKDSKYNERRAECEEALRRLQKKLPIHALGELTSEEFNQYKYLIEDPVLIKRALHAVTENERTLLAVKALESDDIEAFGKLMYASHASLRDDYEVTGDELDALVEAAAEVDGTIGSRMTGAGFGGCSVSIVENNSVDNFIRTVGEKYRNRIGYDADFYVVSIGQGVHRVE